MLPSPLLLLLLVVCTGVLHVAIVGIKLQRLKAKSLAALIQGLQAVDMLEICQVARDESVGLLRARKKPLQTIESLGGVEGVRRLHHNATLMLDIARLLIFMNPQPCDLAQAVRRDAVRVRRLATILKWKTRFGILRIGNRHLPHMLARSYVLVGVNTIRLGIQILGSMPRDLQEFSAINAYMAPKVPSVGNVS